MTIRVHTCSSNVNVIEMLLIAEKTYLHNVEQTVIVPRIATVRV